MPTVGILLDHRDFRRLSTGKLGYEQFSYYNRAAAKQGLTPFYMSLRHMRGKMANGYLYKEHKYRKIIKRIPKVVHNRDIAIASPLRKRLSLLARHSIIFNRQNRFSKLRIHRLLLSHRGFKQHLPQTWRYSKENLLSSLGRHKSLYIKPSSGSVGDGIIKVKAINSGKYQVQWKKGKAALLTLSQMIHKLRRLINRYPYIIQEAIPLAKYHGRPYDIRVSVQRNGSGKWQVTGMVGKVAAPHRHVTNVAKGGKVQRCEVLFENNGFQPAQVKQSISELSLAMANYLGKHLPHLADIGLDIGVEDNAHIQFIEMNGRDQRITFKKAKLKQTFYETYENPMKYAKHLLARSKHQ